MDKLDVEDCEKDTKVTTLPQKKDTKKPSKKEKANTETVIVRRSKRTSAQIVQESHAIVRAWKIVFIQRIHRCTTKAQLIETIEESREELFRRLDEHLRVYTSVEHMVSGSLPQWHIP
ncbi:hypothetical protein G6F68_018750 [Rhizopus microsporus]|nr:hypothetical protein G6F68_018750 [Rhizopus microsporus]